MSKHAKSHHQHDLGWVCGLTLLLCLALSACGSEAGGNQQPAVILDAALAQMSVYISAYTPGQAFALNARDGSVRWRENKGVMYGSQAVANGVVYTISRNSPEITALNARDGTLLWENQRPQTGHRYPVVLNGVVYIGTVAGVLYAFGGPDGKLVWEFDAPGPASHIY